MTEQEGIAGRGGLVAWLPQSVPALGDSWTPSTLLACGGQPYYHGHKDQIPGLEHEQRLLDLARRGACYHSLINVDQKNKLQPHRPLYLFIYFNGANQYVIATIRKIYH